jgi:hypothetical protein
LISDDPALRLLGVLAKVELAERLAESNAVDGLLDDVGTRAVDLADRALAVSVDNKTEQVRAHVVAAEVVESLAEVGLVEVDVDVDQTLEVLGGLGDQGLAVGTVDASVAVVDVVVLGGLARRGLESDTGGRDGLERCQGEGGGLNGVRRGDDVGVGIADVGVRVGVLQGRSVGVQRPGGNVDLLALGDGVGLEERVHVLPAVEVTLEALEACRYAVGFNHVPMRPISVSMTMLVVSPVPSPKTRRSTWVARILRRWLMMLPVGSIMT